MLLFFNTIRTYEVSESKQPALYALQKLFIVMKDCKDKASSAENLLKLINPQPGEQDSSEFLMTLLSILDKEEMDNYYLFPRSHDEDPSEFLPSNEDREIEFANNFQEKFETGSIIQQLFGGMLMTHVECLQCRQVTTKKDFFTELPIFFPEYDEICQKYRIEELIYKFFSPEKLSGDNCYNCQQCLSLQDGVRTQQILSYPQHLILILNRYRFDYTSNRTKKLMHKVHCSEVLELPVALKSTTSAKYRLHAVIIHVGSTSQYGHYYTIIKNKDEEWFRMNDAVVSKINIGELYQLNPIETPYILFYTSFYETKQHLKNYVCSN